MTAISKIVLNGTIQMDLTQDTVGASTASYSTPGHGNNGEPFTGSITSRSTSDLTASGDTVTVPAGLRKPGNQKRSDRHLYLDSH